VVTDGGDGIPTLESEHGTGKGDAGVWGIWITPGGPGSTTGGGDSGQDAGDGGQIASTGGGTRRVRFMNVLNDSARFVIASLGGSGETEVIVPAGPLGGFEGRYGQFAFGTYAVCADWSDHNHDDDRFFELLGTVSVNENTQDIAPPVVRLSGVSPLEGVCP